MAENSDSGVYTYILVRTVDVFIPLAKKRWKRNHWSVDVRAFRFGAAGAVNDKDFVGKSLTVAASLLGQWWSVTEPMWPSMRVLSMWTHRHVLDTYLGISRYSSMRLSRGGGRILNSLLLLSWGLCQADRNTGRGRGRADKNKKWEFYGRI